MQERKIKERERQAIKPDEDAPPLPPRLEVDGGEEGGMVSHTENSEHVYVYVYVCNAFCVCMHVTYIIFVYVCVCFFVINQM